MFEMVLGTHPFHKNLEILKIQVGRVRTPRNKNPVGLYLGGSKWLE
jgi:hypothetical protein